MVMKIQIEKTLEDLLKEDSSSPLKDIKQQCS